jgi:hypothetical protein
MADERERDIELVLVTGAGASCAFGINNTNFPLMSDWSDFLVEKLAAAGPEVLAATGLAPQLSGPEFEARLGEFLQRVAAYQTIEPLLSASFGFSRSATLGQDALLDWYREVGSGLNGAVNTVVESLYECFDEGRAHVDLAVNAYQRLFRALNINHTDRLVYATTNYDTIAEHALRRSGRLIDSGERQTARDGDPTYLDTSGVLDGMPRYTPLLHLHGRIGWYRSDGAPAAVVNKATRHSSEFGVPIVMLPDPGKSYDEQPVIIDTWAEFRAALRRAKKVLVLGHSLNDKPLVDALRDNLDHLERLAVAVLPHPNIPDRPHPSAIETFQRVDDQLPRAKVIFMTFGENEIPPVSFNSWLDQAARVQAGA